MDTLRQLYEFSARNYSTIRPPKPVKNDVAIRVGLLGASQIAPMAIINPALSHPEVIIAAVAARSETTARAYAKKYDIPIVHPTYDALLADPSIDAIYNPLPNGLHYEWTMKALAAGKHVLLEKPSTSNAEEASSLFAPYASKYSPSAQQPVLFEAIHALFHPAFRRFQSLVSSQDVEEAYASLVLPKGIAGPDDIRFNYKLAGGATMDCGTYCVYALRKIFQAEPVQCVEATSGKPTLAKLEGMPIDEAMHAKFSFPNGGIGTIAPDLRGSGGYWFPWLTSKWPSLPTPVARAREKEKAVNDGHAGPEQEHVVSREVTMWNMVAPSFWHRIDIVEEHTLRTKDTGLVIKRWTEKQSVKDYGPADKAFWSSYRWQLEAFVDRVQGRDRVGIWIDGEDSINQMKAIDMVYEKAGLPLRPTSEHFKRSY